MSACNQSKPPEEEGNAQSGTALQEEQPAHNMVDRNISTHSLKADETYIGKSRRYLETPHPMEGDDQLLIEGLIYDMPRVTPGMVLLIGEKAYVNVMFDEYLTEEEEIEQTASILERLIEANPAYEYQVIINHFMK